MKKLPVIQEGGVRVVGLTVDYATNVVTASVRLNGTRFEEEVCLELHRPEHSKARELLQALFAEVTRWRNVAGEVNCGTCRGNCCTSHWGEYGISLSVEDSKTLAAHLGVIWNQFAQEHLISNPTPGDEQFVFKYKDEPRAPTGRCCPFLKIQEDGLGRCTVYEARPRVCREFTAYGCTIHENLPGGTK